MKAAVRGMLFGPVGGTAGDGNLSCNGQRLPHWNELIPYVQATQATDIHAYPCSAVYNGAWVCDAPASATPDAAKTIYNDIWSFIGSQPGNVTIGETWSDVCATNDSAGNQAYQSVLGLRESSLLAGDGSLLVVRAEEQPSNNNCTTMPLYIGSPTVGSASGVYTLYGAGAKVGDFRGSQTSFLLDKNGDGISSDDAIVPFTVFREASCPAISRSRATGPETAIQKSASFDRPRTHGISTPITTGSSIREIRPRSFFPE